MEYNITIVLVIVTALTSYRAFTDRILKENFLFRPAAMSNSNQWYRFLSHGLIHADFTHLLFNMYVLYVFGDIVELLFGAYFGVVIGKALFVTMYVTALAAASIPSYFQHKDNYSYSALGASGAVSGIMFALIFFSPWQMFYLFFIIPCPAILFGIGYLWYSNYMAKRGMDNVGHDAHFWGAVYGFAFTFITALVIQPILVSSFFEQLYQGILITNSLQ
ncbi:MAG: rhomboid family intramembrane serine protease [Saprospiraceae bacterium]